MSLDKIIQNDKPYLTYTEKLIFQSAVDKNQIGFFRIAPCQKLLCENYVPKQTIKIYCSKKCYLACGGVDDVQKIEPEDDDDQW